MEPAQTRLALMHLTLGVFIYLLLVNQPRHNAVISEAMSDGPAGVGLSTRTRNEGTRGNMSDSKQTRSKTADRKSNGGWNTTAGLCGV